MPDYFKCSTCSRVLKTSQGLKSHTTRLHSGILPLVNGPAGASSASSQTSVKFLASNDQSEEVSSASSLESLVSLLANLRGKIKIIHRIPKGARPAAAEALSDSIDKCVRENSEDAWERLLLFTVVCLQVPENQEGRKVSLSTLVKRNITDYLQGKTPDRIQGMSNENNRKDESSHLAKRVEAKISEGDVRGAVRTLCSEDSFSPFNEDTKQHLLELHPTPESPTSSAPSAYSDQESLPPFQVSEADTRSAILSFPAGSAGGLDMLRPQHLKDLIGPSTGVKGLRLLSSIRTLCNIMLAGGVPSEICPVLFGAALCALTKKKGGVRPIAIGSTWRRLVAKMASNRLKTKLSKMFLPIQLGFGVKGGAEAVTHAARRYVSSNHDTGKVFLKIDFRNAYNTVNRKLMLETVSTQLPELLPFLSQCYGAPTHLAFGEEFLSSQEGIQQGDPLGPALFCLMTFPVAALATSELNMWYLDDATLGGSPETVLQDFETIIESAAVIGLEVNFAKCELFLLGDSESNRIRTQKAFQELAPNIRFPEAREFSLLGAPLVCEALEDFLEDKCTALERLSERLGAIKAHIAYYILRNSQAIPKLSYLLRCAPTWRCEAGLHKFDNVLREALESVTNTRIVEDAWEQSALPVGMGGLGLRRAYTLALPAFLSSAHSTSQLIGAILPKEIQDLKDPMIEEGVKLWMSRHGNNIPTHDKKCIQKAWDTPGLERSQANLYDRAATINDKARLLGVASGESGAFLNALPSAPLGTMLDNDSFRIAVGLRVGAQLCQPHTCICGSPVDESGVHGLCCVKSAGRRARHAAVNDLLKRGLCSGNVPAVLEPAHLSSSDNTRPDGVTQIPWAGGKSLAWDFTCTDGLAAYQVSASSVEPLYAASMAEEKKRRKYAHLNQAYIFTPVAVECLGSLGRDSLKFLKEIGSKISEVTGEKRATEFLLQRISVAVQRGNAACVKGTISPDLALEEVYNIL